VRIMVTGSRNFQHPLMVINAIVTEFVANADNYDDVHLTLSEGDCRTGADRFASDFMKEIRSHNPDFFTHLKFQPNSYGPAPQGYHLRNQAMVDRGQDVCLAFLQQDEPNRGTLSTIKRATKAGIPVKTYWSV
jgi:hypothetical protein